MQISRALWEAFQDLLAADTDTLADPTAMHVHLVVGAFVPNLDLIDIGDLDLASFTGSAPKNAGTGAQQTFYDPVTGNRFIQLLEPAGGWTWECTADPVTPEIVYGYVVTDNADAVIWGTDLLPTPVTISAAGQGVSIGQVRMAFTPNSPV